MRALRIWWRRFRGWWLVAAAAASAGALAAVGRVYTGLAAAVLVTVGSAIVAVFSERGRNELAAPARGRLTAGSVYVRRVHQVSDPIGFGVHRAARVRATDGQIDQVPQFVERDQWTELIAALAVGGFVLVVGDSTAGKTRLAYEAMRCGLPGHTCVRPESPDALAAAIIAAKDARPSVLWLDDLERYLRLGGLTQADLLSLLRDGAGKVVVLATMRPREREDFSSRYDQARGPSERESARTGRDVLQAVTSEIELPRLWSPGELASAQKLAHDARIADALRSAGKYGLAEHMAAGPQLLQEFRDARAATPGAWSVNPVEGPRGGPRGAALVQAAIDVWLAGYRRPVPLPLLRELHEVYLRAWGGAALRPDSWDNALAWATQPLHATSSLLEPAGDDSYLAFDYVVDEARRDPATPPIPDAVWQALLQHAEWADLIEVAWQASFARQLDYVESAFARAFAASEFTIAAELANCLGDAGGESRAIQLLETTIAAAEASPAVSDPDLLAMRHMLAWQVGEKVSGHGNPERALEIARRVVGDSTSLYGPAHRETLDARIVLARQVGATGDPRQALTTAREADAAATTAFGADDATTLNARFEVAVWTYAVDGAAASAERFTELIRQAERLEPQPRSLIATSLWNLSSCLSESGDHARAVQASEDAINLGQQLYGATHIRVVRMRAVRAHALGSAGDPRTAADLSDHLADESAGIAGESHLTTLEIRHGAARWTAAAGDHTGAARRYEVLLTDLARILGEDHWLTRQCRAEFSELK
jgi:eukaryotic-like serine/threonine-protein kinase